MFITLLYGDNEERILNPDCNAVNFLRYIKDICGYGRNDTLDLIDENGDLKNLIDLEDVSAASALTYRSVYLPVLVERNEEEGLKNITPLFNRLEELYPKAMKKIKKTLGAASPTKPVQNPARPTKVPETPPQEISSPTRGGSRNKKRK